MKVRLQEIDEKPSHFEFQMAREELTILEKSYEFKTVNCQASLFRSQEYFILKGSYQVQIRANCHFCLEPVLLDLDESFSLDLVQEGSQNIPEGDLEITMDSPDMDFFQGEVIQLTKYFEEQLILDCPFSIICSDDCEGLCASCGQNLNQTDCSCSTENSGNPFAVLKELIPDKK